jgi:3-phosphoshikimate 1-carboxyvinyltransferase
MTGVNPTRTGLLAVLEAMGAGVVRENEGDVSGEPAADLVVRSAELRGVEISDAATVASVIDEIPVIAVAATQAAGETNIRGAGELRHKECDRIRATVEGLAALGADVEEHEDGMTIRGPSRLRGAGVSSFGDHRIAMAMTVAGMLADGETVIDDASAVDVSYPRFFNDLMTVVR